MNPSRLPLANNVARISEVPSAIGNTPFTRVEQGLIAAHLRTIEAHIVQSAAPSQEQHAELKEQIAYLTEATSRLGRFDWRGLASSTFIGIVVQLGLTPERINGLTTLATQLLGPFITRAGLFLGTS